MNYETKENTQFNSKKNSFTGKPSQEVRNASKSLKFHGEYQKGQDMDEMNICETLVAKTEENQTRKILELLNSCETLEEAKEKVKQLINNK